MTKTAWLASTAIVIAAVLATAPANADGKTKEQLRDQEIQELKARIERLEREAEDEKIVQSARLKKVEDAQEAVQWTFNDGRPTVRSGDGRFEMALRGRVQLDVASFEQDPGNFGAGYGAPGACNLTNALCDQGSGAVFRRVRFGIEGKFFRDFIYELRFDFGGSGSEGSGVINIARIGYVGVPGLRVHAGAIQPVFTMYESTSSADLTTMERAGIITVLAAGFGAESARRGVEATYQEENLLYDGDNFMISAAFTGEKIGADHTGIPNNDENTQLLGRVAYRLYGDGTNNVQVGASASTLLDPSSTVQLRERPEIRVGGDRYIDTGAITVDGGDAYGFEFGANFENFYLAAEWYQMSLDRPTGLDPEFDGWYVEGEWIFTGENKRYSAAATNNNVAVFRGPSVTAPWSPGGGTGAWSLHARHSVLDLNFNEGLAGAPTPPDGVRGGEQTITNIGLTWYVNTNLKLMAEYAMVEIDRIAPISATDTLVDNADASADFDIIQGRLQFTF